jgi:hypothetical protein
MQTNAALTNLSFVECVERVRQTTAWSQLDSDGKHNQAEVLDG